MVCNIPGRRVFVWRAVDSDGENPDPVVQRRCDARAALNTSKQLLRRQSVEPESIVTDALASTAQRSGSWVAKVFTVLVVAREQSPRALASVDPTARTKDARAQITRIRPTASDNPRRDLDCSRSSTAHDQAADAPDRLGAGRHRLVEGGRRIGIPRSARKSALPS